MSSMRRATLFFLGLAALLIGALQFLDQGVGPLEKPMSSYALGEFALLWMIAVVAGGAAMILQGVSWRRRAPQSIGWRLLVATGASFIVSGVFSSDPWYPWQHALTMTGWIHVLATGAAMSGLACSMLCEFTPRERRDASPLARVTRIVAAAYVVIVACTVVFTLALIATGREPPLIGLEERVLLVATLVWLSLRAFR